MPQWDNQLVLSGERGWGRVSWGSVVPGRTAPHGPTCCFLLSFGRNRTISLCCRGERGWGRVSWGSVVPWGTAPHGPTCCFRWQVRLCYQTSAPIGQSPYPTHFFRHKKRKNDKLFWRGAGRTRMTLWQQHVRDSDTVPHHCRRHVLH